MRGRGGGSSNWREEVRLRISQEAEGVRRSLPPCFRRFDAFGNQDHPSIFKRGNQKTSHHVAIDVVGAGAKSLQQLAAGAAAKGAAPQVGFSGSREPAGGPQIMEATTMGILATGRDPVVVAVGPYHQHRLSPRTRTPPPLTSRAKKCRIVMFLAEHFGLDVDDFLVWALNKEAQARGCYERDSFAMDDPKEMAEMLLLDGCLLLFCVFLLRKSVCEDQRPAELTRNKTYGKEFIYLSADISLHMKQTRLDLLMLYNQIPFFVLAELHRRLKSKGSLFESIDHSIEELALSCFDEIHPACRFTCWPPPRDAHGGGAGAAAANHQFPVVPVPPPPKVHHLLHLFHLSRVPGGKHEVGISSIVPKEPEHHLPCVTELKESLTRVRKKKKKSHTTAGSYDDYPLDISFERKMLGTCAVLSIPELCIHNYSDCVFRSLIAFEQNHLRCGLGATAYAICMSWLLRSEADVKVLRNKGILMHTQKNDKEIVDFFRGLRDEYPDTCLPEDLLALCKEVAAHQRSRPAAVVKRVGRQCFPRQTVTFFVIVGTIISLATLVNTIHTMYRYYHPFKGVNPLYGH